MKWSMKKLKILTISALFCSGLLAGCSSIVTHETQELEVLTNPETCSITITDDKGNKVFEGYTPAKVELNKDHGYFEGCVYDIHLEKGGFQPQDLVVKSKNTSWYVFGNTLNVFIPGWISVDPKMRRMHELMPAKVEVHMVPME